MLNNEDVPSPGGSKWSESAIWTILRNEIYAGNMIWNKTSQKMKSPLHHNPEPDWIRAEDAFEPIVPKELYYLIQGIIKGRQQEKMRRYSREDMLARLKSLFDRYGIIKSSLISGDPEMVSPSAYTHQFQTLDKAYQSMFSDIILQKRNEIVKMLHQGEAEVEHVEDFIVIDNLFSVSIQPIVPLPQGYEACWIFHPDQRKVVDLTIGVPLSCPRKFDVLGYLAFPRVLFRDKVRIHSREDGRMGLYGFPIIPLIEKLRK
jgi:hypothetical protein